MKFVYSLIVLVFLASSCSTSRYASTDNLGTLYDAEASGLKPKFFVYHPAKDSTFLYFKIPSKELLYLRNDKSQPFYAQVLISYIVFDNFENKAVLDSASKKIRDVDNEKKPKDLVGKIRLKLPAEGNRFVARITTYDPHRKQERISIVNINRTKYSRQNFLVLKAKNEVPVFSRFLDPGEELIIRSNASSPKVLGRYYSREFPMAAPPFSLAQTKPFRYEADSLFTLFPLNNGDFSLKMPKKGFFHLQTDTTTKNGLTLFSFSKEYPRITQSSEMIPPLRYITSKDEYNSLARSASPKQAIDKFWLDAAGSEDRAREVIRKFYSRIQTSNTYFTSFVEGWKTDRGLLYIIFGNPSTIYRTSNSETWIYGEENNLNSISFTFRRVKNPFSDNDYLLSRSPNYKISWYRALESWRQGRAFSSR